MCTVLLAVNLKKLRNELEYTQREVAERLGISRGMLSNYELGTREPDLKTLMVIANFFNVSIDYLVGVSAIRKPLNISERFRETLNDILTLTDESKEDLIKYVKLLKLRDRELRIKRDK